MVRAAAANAAFASPSLRASIASLSASRPWRIWREIVAESSVSWSVALKRMSSASAPRIADQLSPAITAAPPGIPTTCVTPGTERAAFVSIDSTCAPNTGLSRAQA